MVREYQREMGFSFFFFFFKYRRRVLPFFFSFQIFGRNFNEGREARENSKIVLSKKRRKEKGIIVDYSFSLVSKYHERERERERFTRRFDNVFWNVWMILWTRSYVTYKPLTYSSAHKCRRYISTTSCSWIISIFSIASQQDEIQQFDNRSIDGKRLN